MTDDSSTSQSAVNWTSPQSLLNFPNGKLRYRHHGPEGTTLLHRDPKEGPAAECFYENGNLSYCEYCTHDKLHRDPKDGPAVQHFNKDGTLTSQRYFVHGEEIFVDSSEYSEVLKLQERVCFAELARDSAVAEMNKISEHYKAKNKAAGDKISELILERKVLKAKVKELELLLKTLA